MIVAAPGGPVALEDDGGTPPLFARPLTSRSVERRAAWVAVAICTAVGLVLRLAAARGDLWLDELWSLDLVSRVTSPDQVFWDIPHDNNHPLNSLWMVLVGQGAPPLVYRLPAVIFGTATVAVAARIGARVNTAAGVAAAALTCCSYPLVDYGSEARGYAGLILAILVAIDLATCATSHLVTAVGRIDPEHSRAHVAAARRFAWPIAIVVLFGTCSHLIMTVEAAILAVVTAARLKGAGLPLRAALDETVALFRPSLLLLLPLLAALGTGVVLHHGITVGGVEPFSPALFDAGFGGLVQVILGLPYALPHWLGPLVASAILVAAFRSGVLDVRWRTLAWVALVVWPAVVLTLRVPNTGYARYFLAAGIVLPVFLAEIAGRLWAKAGVGRVAAAVGVTAICVGQIPYLHDLLVEHRGAPSSAVALMAGAGPARFVARSPWSTNSVVDVYAARLGADLKPVAARDGCQAGATWLVIEADYGEAVPDRSDLDGPGCAATFEKAGTFPAALWSGRSWTVYRRKP